VTIDMDKQIDEVFRDDAAPSADAPEAVHPEAGPASGDGGRRDGEGGDGGGGHTRMARWAEKYDVRNSWQVIAGALLIPLGVVFILLGWYGAAHARVVQQQIPYMVSGSFIGLGCMIVGGLLFFGHWLYRIYDQADLHQEEQMKVLEGILAALGGSGLGSAGSTGARPPVTHDDGGSGSGVPEAAGPGRGSPGAAYYATSSGTVYHRADCAVVAHHPEELRVLGPEGVASMRPCQICSPD
jgi:hypothetical protein